MRTELTLEHILSDEFKAEYDPCQSAIDWLKTQTDIQTAWKNCLRGDWMLWLLDELDLLTERQELAIQLAMLETPLHNGGKVLDLVTDERSLAFLDLKRRKLAGENINNEKWSAARDAAWDAWTSATAIAWAAARAAADATFWAVAWSADAADADAATAIATAAAREWQANRIREIINFDIIVEA